MIKNLLFSLLVSLTSSPLLAAVFTVYEEAGNDWSKPLGSYLWAVDQVNATPGPHTIEFDLPGGATIEGDDWNKANFTQENITINGFSSQDGGKINMKVRAVVEAKNIILRGLNFISDAHTITVTKDLARIEDCSFVTNSNANHSIFLTSGSKSVIKNCDFISSKGHSISVDAGGFHEIINCTATNSKNVSFVFYGDGNNIIKDCDVSLAKQNGIGLASPNNTVDNCTTYSNDRAGIAVDNILGLGTATGNIIKNCTVYNNNNVLWGAPGAPNDEQGAIFTDGANTTIDNNFVFDNKANGIMVKGGNNNIATDKQLVINNTVGRSSSGVEAGNYWNGIFIWETNNAETRDNLVVNNGNKPGNYRPGVRVSGIRYQETNSGQIQDNYIGTDELKTLAGNGFDGITLYDKCSEVSIISNTICYNGFGTDLPNFGGGVALREGSFANTIESNNIGVHKDNTDGGNNDYGISLEGSNNNIIGGTQESKGNIIANSKNNGSTATDHGVGIWLVKANSDNNEIYFNTIKNHVGNGITIEREASGNIIGAISTGNSIIENEHGISIKGNGVSGTDKNTMRGNSFSCNRAKGISLTEKGNGEYGETGASKIVNTNSSESRPNFVSGKAPAGALVDVYVRDSNCSLTCLSDSAQGVNYVSTVSADGSGMWEYDLTSSENQAASIKVTKENVIVLATEPGGAGNANTSEFSVCNLKCTPPTSVTVTGSTICPSPSSATLIANAEGLNTGSDYQYYWYKTTVSPGNEIIPRSALNDNDFLINSPGNYFVVVSDTSDPVTCTITSKAQVVEQVSKPDVSVDNEAICPEGDPVKFTAKSDSEIDSYLWKGNGTGAAQTTQGSTLGLYTVDVTDKNGCVNSASGLLSAVPLPNISVNSEEICEGDDPVTFIATSDVQVEQYLWSDNGSGTESTTTGTDAGKYTVLVTDINGCQNNGSGILTVKPAPTADLTPTNPSFCIGDSVEIKIENLDEQADIVWTPAQNPPDVRSFFVKSGDPLTYSIEITLDGCVSLPGNEVTVREDTIPLVKTDTVRFCEGATAVLDIGIPDMLYKWLLSGETTQTIEVTEQNKYLYFITDPLTNCSSLWDTIFADISPYNAPKISLSDNDSICFPKDESVEIKASVLTDATESELEWSNGIINDTLITYSDTGIVWVRYNDSYNCLVEDSVNIYNYCIPPDVDVPNIIIIGDCNTCSPFTPIGNITPEDVVNGRMEVYDRWGLKMYETNDLIPSWDAKYNGSLVSAGVYFWIWVYEDVTKTTHNLNGFVEILTK